MASPDFMIGYLRGLFDGEGSAFFKTHVGGKRHTSYYLTVSNTDLAIMNTVRDYLDALGIGHSQFQTVSGRITDRGTIRKTIYHLHITKAEDILAFANDIGFTSIDKQSTLEVMVGWINRSKEHWASDEIYRLRQEGYSFRQIASILGYAEGAHSHIAELYRQEDRKWQTKQENQGELGVLVEENAGYRKQFPDLEH